MARTVENAAAIASPAASALHANRVAIRPKNKLPLWFKPKVSAPPPQVGVGWYTAEDWQKVKACAKVPERLEATSAEWEAMAEQSLAHLRAQGIDAKKSYVVASDLTAWCLAKNKPNEASSRAAFVSRQGAKVGASGP